MLVSNFESSHCKDISSLYMCDMTVVAVIYKCVYRMFGVTFACERFYQLGYVVFLCVLVFLPQLYCSCAVFVIDSYVAL